MEDALVYNKTKIESSVEAFKSQLAIPTEVKEEPFIAEPETVAVEPGNIEEIEDVSLGKKILSAEMLETETNIGLSMIDFTQQNILRFSVNVKRKRKLVGTFGENSVERADILSHGGVPKDDMTDTDKAILKIQKKVDEVIEDLPFSDEECKVLRPLLEKWIIANNGKLPENFFAYLGLIQIFGGRLLNVLMI